ncbi:MAG: DUF624 domain-containing protein [Firmicutes bacterium]|jgi:uncharacterized membrane protein YesL|nr:DUF624 domain-containing protein [Bacillota bacterium]
MAGQSISKSWLIIRRGIRYSYDYLGMVIAASALWFITGFFPILVVTSFSKFIQNPAVIGVGIFLTVVTMGPATAAVHGIATRIVQNEDVRVREFFTFFQKFFSRSAALVLLNVLILLILASDLIFTLNSPNKFIQMLSGIWIYFFIFWALMSNYIFPFLVNQNIGVFLTMKRSALLALDNLVVTIALSVAVLIVVVLSVILAAPVLLLMLGIIAFLQNVSYHELMQKYDDAPSQGTTVETTTEGEV